MIHPGAANVSKKEIQTKLAENYKVAPECAIVFGFRTDFGGGKSTGFGLVYDNVDAVKKFEPKYRQARQGLMKKREGSRKQIKEKKNRSKKVFGLGKRIARHKAKKANN